MAPKYLYRDYFKDKVYTIWVHGPLGTGSSAVFGSRAKESLHKELGNKPYVTLKTLLLVGLGFRGLGFRLDCSIAGFWNLLVQREKVRQINSPPQIVPPLP